MSRRRRRAKEPPQVHPFDVDGVRTVAVGTVLWAAAFVVLALRRTALDAQGFGWWLWTCLAGVGLGLLGLEYTRKRRDAIAQALLDEEADRSDEQAEWGDAAPSAEEPAEEPTDDPPPGVRRVRRDTPPDDEEISEGGTVYRGRRARRR